jgi:hypothetical protein
MRSAALFLLLAGMCSCGSSQKFSGTAHLSEQHYRFGQQIDPSPVHDGSEREQRVWIRPRAIERLVSVAPSSKLRGADVLISPVREEEAMASCAPPIPPSQGSLRTDRPTDDRRITEPRTLQEELPERSQWNWLAVSSPVILLITLIAAIPAESTVLLLIGCLAALAAAIFGAEQCREKGQKGQGFAMAVMGLAAAGALLSIIALLARL